jgi:hypothetical protein
VARLYVDSPATTGVARTDTIALPHPLASWVPYRVQVDLDDTTATAVLLPNPYWQGPVASGTTTTSLVTHGTGVFAIAGNQVVVLDQQGHAAPAANLEGTAGEARSWPQGSTSQAYPGMGVCLPELHKVIHAQGAPHGWPLSSGAKTTLVAWVVVHSAAYSVCLVSFMRLVYSLSCDRLPRMFWVVLAGAAGVLAMGLARPPANLADVVTPGLWTLVISLVASREALQVITTAVWQRRDGAAVVALGFAVFLSLLSGYALGALAILPIRMPRELLFWGFLGVILSLSACLARDWANTNRRCLMLAAENGRRANELGEARKLQLSMLPRDVPVHAYLDIAWYMETATEVGGDYYDCSLGPDGTPTLALGDATGHGMMAGTIVTAAKSLFKAFADRPVITEAFTAMSRSPQGMNLPRLGMAMAMIRIRDHHLTVSSAGTPPVLIYRAASSEIEEVEIPGVPLGCPATSPYQQRELDLCPGDVLVLVSDGLPERRNAQDEELGYPATQALFREAVDKDPGGICRHLADGGGGWAGEDPRTTT